MSLSQNTKPSYQNCIQTTWQLTNDPIAETLTSHAPGLHPVPLFLSSLGLQNPCRDPFPLGANPLQSVTTSAGKEGAPIHTPLVLEMLTPMCLLCGSSSLDQSDPRTCMAVLVPVHASV